MKDKLFKKYDNLILLSIASVVSLLLPSYITIKATKATTVVEDMWAGTHQSDSKIHTDVTLTNVRDANANDVYAHPSNPDNREAMVFSVKGNGKTNTWTVYRTEASAEYARTTGACAGTCISASEIGLSGTNIADWGNQIKTSSKNQQKDGKNLQFSDSISKFQARETLRLYGYDVENMSDDSISKAANDLVHNNGKFSEAVYGRAAIIVKQPGYTDSGKLEYSVCPSGTSNSDCYEALHSPLTKDLTEVALDGELVYITDEGGISTRESCEGDCCPGDPGYPTCDSGSDDDDDDSPKYELTYDTCSVSIPEIPAAEPREKPGDTFTGGSCGSTAVDTKYELSSTCGGRILMLKTTTVTAQLPSAPNVVYAGKGFNWGDVSSTKNTSVVIYDTSIWVHDIQVEQANVMGYEAAIACVDKSIAKLGEDYGKAMKSCADGVASSCASCYSPCKNYSCTATDKNTCTPPTCNCTATCDVDATCGYLTAEYEKDLAILEAQKAAYQQQVEVSKNKIQELLECNNSAKSLISYSNQFDTVSITNQRMELNKYVQTINSIKGVAKNSGLELTAADLKEYTDPETYLSINTNFFVPYYIKNGTSGKVVGDIAGDISIPNYNCPISVTNNVLCKDDDCKVKPSNLDLIYRPISLTNPFPDTVKNSKYRAMGSNWTELYAKLFIINNRGVGDYEIYNLTPIYTITLTPSTIKEIRNYNKKNSLNDFDMNCTDGYRCISTFLWEKFNKIIDTSDSCATSTGLYEVCYTGGASE